MTKDEKLTAEVIRLFGDMPIYIATKKIQRRKHHKKRINKKWSKRYGFIELNYMPHGTPIFVDGVLWMTQRDFDKLKLRISEKDG